MKKTRILFSVLFIGLLLLALFSGDRAVYMTVYALAALLAASLACVFLAPFLVKLEEAVDKRFVFKNEELVYTVKAVTRFSFLYPKVEFAMHSGALVGYDRGDEANSHSDVLTGAYVLRFPYRGKYRVGVQRITVTGFLGMFKYSFPCGTPEEVLVYPERDEGFSLRLNTELLNKAASQYDIFDHVDADVSSVRKYDPSDDYRKIHWKLSAKRGEIIIKNYQSSMLNKTMLLLDTRPPAGLTGADKAAFEDKAASLAASSLNYLVKSRLPAELVYGDGREDNMTVETVSDMDNAMRLLAGLEFREGGSIAGSMDGNVTKDNGIFNIIVFLTGVDDGIIVRLKALINYGHSLILYYICPPGMKPRGSNEKGLEGMRAMGAEVSIVYSE